MSYVDGFVAAVPTKNKEKYIEHARLSAVIFKEHGALHITEAWGENVPDGEVTSFPMAVNCAEDETVVFSTIAWPSKEVRDAGWEAIMEGPRMQPDHNPMPCDGKRLSFGGFDVILET